MMPLWVPLTLFFVGPVAGACLGFLGAILADDGYAAVPGFMLGALAHAAGWITGIIWVVEYIESLVKA